MKPTTLIYCGENGEAGKAIAASLRDGKSHVVLCSAGAFAGRAERACDRVVFTNDVPAGRRREIASAHGIASAEASISGPQLTSKHRGRGRWFVMRGAEIVSGPHTKEQAQRLAA